MLEAQPKIMFAEAGRTILQATIEKSVKPIQASLGHLKNLRFIPVQDFTGKLAIAGISDRASYNSTSASEMWGKHKNH